MGPYTIRGYLAVPERNAEVVSADGFYRTGDLLREWIVDGSPSLTFEGRSKDLINRGGEKIASVEIESLIAELPGVRGVALIPIPDERLGERGCVCIETRDRAFDLTLADIQRFLADREVAKYKWPERVELVSELPLTSVGKVNKRALLTQILTRDSSATSRT